MGEPQETPLEPARMQTKPPNSRRASLRETILGLGTLLGSFLLPSLIALDGANKLGLAAVLLLLLFVSGLIVLVITAFCFRGLVMRYCLLAFFGGLAGVPAVRWVGSGKVQETELRAYRIETALLQYKRDKGRFPERLAQLQPDYLDSIPKSAMSFLIPHGFDYDPEHQLLSLSGGTIHDGSLQIGSRKWKWF